MDINELLHREQISFANAMGATCCPSRRAHEDLARAYGERLISAGYAHRPYYTAAVRPRALAVVDAASGER